MKLEPGYQTYLTALGELVELPAVETKELADIERSCRSECDALERSRRESAERWVGMRDQCSRLSRRVDELARRVGVSPEPTPASEILTAAALPGAIEAFRKQLEQAESSWDWLQRHRERRTAVPLVQAEVPSTPVSVPPSIPASAVESRSVDNSMLLKVGLAVIVLLVIVVILLVV